MKEQVEKHNEKPMYRGNICGQVMQRSIMTLQEDGSASTSMGFPICEVPQFVEPRHETAKIIATALNCHDELLEALEDLTRVLYAYGSQGAEYNKTMQAAEVAIKKARGES